MRDNKIAEIDRIYVAELEKLQKKHMKDGALDAANRIAEEIKNIMPDPFVEEFTPSKIIGKWKRIGSGTKFDGDIFEFSTESQGNYNGSEEFKVRFNSTKKTITIDNGKWTNEITQTDQADVLKAVADNGMIYQLVRVR